MSCLHMLVCIFFRDFALFGACQYREAFTLYELSQASRLKLGAKVLHTYINIYYTFILIIFTAAAIDVVSCMLVKRLTAQLLTCSSDGLANTCRPCCRVSTQKSPAFQSLLCAVISTSSVFSELH